jgi:sugar/nucleoside kinase (ribokinase family)
MVLCALGDLVLDVIVRPEQPLVDGDDVIAATAIGAGGQAANVAAWAVALGAEARFVGHRGDDGPGRLVEAELADRGVRALGPVGGRTGVIVSIIGADRDRSMASDRGSATELTAEALQPAWLAGTDWLHVSGYMLAEETGARTSARAAQLAHQAGARVSVDAASATLVRAVGAAVFRARVTRLAPDLVFGTEAEFAALGTPPLAATLVVKRGPAGCRVFDGGPPLELPAQPASAVDATGAGDAFAAGFLVGGPRLALAAGARCVSKTGAMP